MSNLSEIKKITIDKQYDCLSCEDGWSHGHRAVLNIYYKDLAVAQGIYLTPKDAERLGKWLVAYSKEKNSRSKKR